MPKPSTSVLLAFVLILHVSLASAEAPPATDVQLLLKAIKGHAMVIRNFYRGGGLSYDAQGNLTSKQEPGCWTLDGEIEVAGADYDGKRVRIVGDRNYLKYDDETHTFRRQRIQDRRLTMRDDVTITIATGPGLTPERLAALLNRVFVSSEELPAALPPHWRLYFSLPEELRPQLQRQIEAGDDAPEKLKLKGKFETAEPLEKVVTFVSHGPDPRKPYSMKRYGVLSGLPEEMRRGVSVTMSTVNERGEVADVQVIKPLGIGIDDSLIEAIKGRKFRPATLDGKPVRVQIINSWYFGQSPPKKKK